MTHQTRAARFIALALGAMLAALAGRLVFIYVLSSQPLAARAAGQHYMRMPIRPIRGSLLDARLRILAGSVECPSVFADPAVIRDVPQAAVAIAPLLGRTRDEVYRDLARDPAARFVWLARRVSPEVAGAVKEARVYGVGLVNEGRRRYPGGALAAHVIGFVGREEQGLEGLEKLYDQRLAGRAGEAIILADRRRRPIWTEPDQFLSPRDGQHLILTIDSAIQSIVEEALAAACDSFQAKSGSAIVMDPQTGAVLAMANVPTFDPARYQEFSGEARRNRAVSDAYPPGSTVKPCIAAKALEAGVVRLGEVIYCEDGFWAAERLRDAGHRYGDLAFEMILVKSSNIGMAKLGMRLGNARLHEGLGSFGFGRPTGIWFPGEREGLVYPLARWTRYSTTRVAFGQEFACTPLQLITAFCALANGGRMLRPKLLWGVLDARGEVVQDLSQPEVVGQAVPPEVARLIVDQILTQAVEVGTGKNCRIPGYRVFGKTGTAQGTDPETGEVSHTRYLSTFVGGAPADRPRVVVLVTVNEPDKSLGFYGGKVAAPAVRTILEGTLTYLGIPPAASPPARFPTYLVSGELGP